MVIEPEELGAMREILPRVVAAMRIFQGARDTAVPEGFALRASALIMLSSCAVIPASSGDGW
jgi:hypothetical protein